MRSIVRATLAFTLLSSAAPVLAQEAEAPSSPLTVTGGVTLVTDYRFRGVSQSAEAIAVQGAINLNHESGLYGGVWASSIDEETIAYGHTEVDLIAGWTGELSPGLTGDIGVVYYLYPNAAAGADTDFFEGYASLRGSLGPATVKVGANYAPDQASTFSDDNLYLYSDFSLAIPETPVTAVAHFGYSSGSLGQFIAASGGAPADGDYLDWSLGLDVAVSPVTLGIRYVDTDVGPVAFGGPRDLADGAVLFSIGASF